MRRKLPLIALLLVQACEPAADVEPLDCDNPVPGISIVGKGNLETGFKDLEDGADLLFVLGPQGMHMIVLSVRIDHFELPTQSAHSTFIRTATRVDGQVVGGVQGRMVPVEQDGDVVEFLGIRSVFPAEIEAFSGKVADIDITAEDGCGREIRATRTVRLVR